MRRTSLGTSRLASGMTPTHIVASRVSQPNVRQMCSRSGDQATALNYSLIMRNEGDRFYLWRVSGVRWDLERVDSLWRVRRRTNRLLDASGVGSRMFRDTLQELFEEGAT